VKAPASYQDIASAMPQDSKTNAPLGAVPTESSAFWRDVTLAEFAARLKACPDTNLNPVQSLIGMIEEKHS